MHVLSQPGYGGMQQYVEWSNTSNASTVQQFYQDPSIQVNLFHWEHVFRSIGTVHPTQELMPLQAHPCAELDAPYVLQLCYTFSDVQFLSTPSWNACQSHV